MRRLRVDLPDRQSALDLSRRLAGFRTYVVQLGRERWYLTVHLEGEPDDVARSALVLTEEWVEEHEADAVVRVDGREQSAGARAQTV